MPCAWLGPETSHELELEEEERYNASLAARQQREYEAEDAALRREREELERSQQLLFDCMICMEQLPEDFIARVEKCQHAICRDCVRGHIMSWIMEHRYPVFCPICMAGKVQCEPAGALICLSGYLFGCISRHSSKHWMPRSFSKWVYHKRHSRSTTSCRWPCSPSLSTVVGKKLLFLSATSDLCDILFSLLLLQVPADGVCRSRRT
jgi:hypothetical protein